MYQILRSAATGVCLIFAFEACGGDEVDRTAIDNPVSPGGAIPVSPIADDNDPRKIAFPGAVGYGRFASGWRGGDVVYVTSLANDGPGTLRECAEHDGRGRICVFGVSGTITIDDQIRPASNTYIAGQTAPGRGVQIKLGAGRNSPLMILEARDVLVRNLKFRPGPSRTPSSNVDGLAIESSSNIYVDRVSVQFATDENLSLGTEDRPSEDITIARSITAFALDKSNHPKGRHSKGALLCADDGTSSQCGRVTLYANLFAHNRDRNPDIASSPSGSIDIVNNVFYDATSQFGEFRNLYGDTWINYVGNVVLPGRSTRESSPPAAFEVLPFGADEGFVIEVFERDNIHRANKSHDDCDRTIDRRIADEDAAPYLVSAPRSPLSVKPITSAQTLELVLAEAGARHGSDKRLDDLDAAVIANVRSCRGRRIDRPGEAGGWPDMPRVNGPLDTDRDGMPDAWEQARAGLDATDPSDTWHDRDGDGWSNIEEYLSHLAGDPVS